jgi:hypothetical protein
MRKNARRDSNETRKYSQPTKAGAWWPARAAFAEEYFCVVRVFRDKRINSKMSTPFTSGPRQRTCLACGKKYEYPVKGGAATRHHCEDCVELPAATRKIVERLNHRVTQLENQLLRLQK